MSKKKIQVMCVNGCDAPISPPSKVICRSCQDKITATLRAMATKEDGDE